jgi:chromosome segregation ATPase
MRLPTDDLDGATKWQLLQQFVHGLTGDKAVIHLTEKVSLDVKSILRKVGKDARPHTPIPDPNSASDFTATLMKLEKDLRDTRKKSEEKEAEVKKLKDEIELLLSENSKSKFSRSLSTGDQSLSEREIKLNDENLLLKDEIESLKHKLDMAKQGIAPSEDTKQLKAFELEVSKLRVEVQKVKELETIIEQMKKEQEDREEELDDLDYELEETQKELSSLKAKQAQDSSRRQNSDTNPDMFSKALLEEMLENNKMLQGELDRERKALDEERVQKKQREQKILQFNDVILRLQQSISSSHDAIKTEHEAEYKRLNDELGAKIQVLKTKLETESQQHLELRKKLSEKVNELSMTLDDERAINASHKSREAQLRQQITEANEEKYKLEEEIAQIKLK